MSIQSQFREFNKIINLNIDDARLKVARDKRDSINEDIKSKFKENEWGDATTFLQGSYATRMAIVPLDGDYDIDVAVTIPKDSAPDNPVTVKNDIQKIFVARGLSGASIKRPCVTAQYMKESKPLFHIDYPIYRVDENENYNLGWGKPSSDPKDKKWIESDPKTLVDWSKNTKLDDDARNQYRYIVRYLKRWRDLRYSSDETKPFSIGLTIMIRQSYIESFDSDGVADDLNAIIKTIDKIFTMNYFIAKGNDKYDLVVNLPVLPFTDVFKSNGTDLGTKLYNRLKQLKQRLIKAQEQNTVKASCRILSEDFVFGSDFPIPDDSNGKNKSTIKHTLSGGAVGSPQGA